MEKEVKEEVIEETTEEVVEKKEEEISKKEPKKEKKEELSEEFVDKKEKSKFSKIMNVILWIILIAWMGACLFDFFNTKKGNAPTFCISKTTKTYSDGTTTTCVGPGYKVYNYKRDSIKAVEFGPLWGKERLSDLK